LAIGLCMFQFAVGLPVYLYVLLLQHLILATKEATFFSLDSNINFVLHFVLHNETCTDNSILTYYFLTISHIILFKC
jgi:hypothetical protein